MNIQLQTLPTYALARKLPAPKEPHVLWSEEVLRTSLPSAVPFAVIQLTGETRNPTPERVARIAHQKAKEAGADYVLITRGGQAYAGSVGVYWGFGVSSSQPIVVQTFSAYCLRLTPARLGFEWDQTGMVTAISNESLRAGGLLEGDKVLSVDGYSVLYGNESTQSPHVERCLLIKPNETFKLVWIRPNVGRMEGVGVAQANPPIHLSLPTAYKPQPMNSENSESGRPRSSWPNTN